jgi:hypothetical protein
MLGVIRALPTFGMLVDSSMGKRIAKNVAADVTAHDFKKIRYLHDRQYFRVRTENAIRHQPENWRCSRFEPHADEHP